jgi:GT2 family glycosyltransferase
MKVTVVLCTYNRCKSLASALESLALSAVPDVVDWEVLVVDNNSSDETRDVVYDHSDRYPGRFRYLFEGKQGKSHALNAGVNAAQGDVLVFADDDVFVEPSWLANLTLALRDGDWAGAGGRILPEPGFVPPPWLTDAGQYALAPFAVFDRGADFGELREPPFGTNMAFRKTVFEKHGGFRTDLGPCPGSAIRNEDTEFGRRVMAAGERLCYVPSAVVYHPVPEERLDKRYHLSWWFAKGRADVREFGISNGSMRLLGVPLVLIRRAAMLSLRCVSVVDTNRRFALKLKLWCAAGMIKECLEVYWISNRGQVLAPKSTST